MTGRLDQAFGRPNCARRIASPPAPIGDCASTTRTAAPIIGSMSTSDRSISGSFAEPLSHDTLFRWHRMLMAGRQDLAVIGGYRVGDEPMQVHSGPVHAPRVRFEAPYTPAVPHEMDRFVDWFNRTAMDSGDSLPALTRAGIAHIYFESVHPFEDGNGRIGRAISEKALAQGLQRPTLIALAGTILLRTRPITPLWVRQTGITRSPPGWPGSLESR